MRLNQGKCYFIIPGSKFEAVWTKIGKTQVWEKRKQKLLGVFIENDLNFDKFLITLYKKQGKN